MCQLWLPVMLYMAVLISTFRLCICEFMQQATPVPKQPSSHLAQFRMFDRRTDDVHKTRHAQASTATNCGSMPKVFDHMIKAVHS